MLPRSPAAIHQAHIRRGQASLNPKRPSLLKQPVSLLITRVQTDRARVQQQPRKIGNQDTLIPGEHHLPETYASLSQSNSLASNVEPTAMSSVKGGKRFQGFEGAICRLYYFHEQQLEVYEGLTKSMTSCRSALAALAVANITLTIVQASGAVVENPAAIAESGLTVGDVAYWLDSLMVAGLITYAVVPFERVLSSRSNQMAYAFQGVNRLALVFQQLSIGSIAVSTVTALEAAAKYPPLVVGTSAVFFAVAAIRSVAIWWTLSKHSTDGEEVSRTLTALRDPSGSSYAQQMSALDKFLVWLAFGYLLQFEGKEMQGSASQPSITSQALAEQPAGSGKSSAAAAGMTYQFSLAEERVLRGLTEAASTAGLALGLQAFVTLMLTVADFGVEDWPGVVSNGINGANKGVMSWILFAAVAAYDRALHTAGSNDVDHLMDGLGHKGLTGLFDALAVLSWAVTLATLAGLALPFIEENVVARMVGDGLSHRTAEAVIEVLEGIRTMFRMRV